MLNTNEIIWVTNSDGRMYFKLIPSLDSIVHNKEFSSQVLRCHLCISQNIEIISIWSNESFRIDYNLTQGMEIEFYKSCC
jgi:hypothetical protein